jgi:hypothetical protein
MRLAGSERRYLVWALIGTPVVVLAAYVAWLVVPEVIRVVVPAVVRSVTGA